MVDFETHLRSLLGAKNGPVTLWINDEARVQFAFAGREFISFGNEVLPVPDEKASKPPTQRAVVKGFDAHRPMGSRR